VIGKIQGGTLTRLVIFPPPRPLAASASGQRGLRPGAGLNSHVSTDFVRAGESKDCEGAGVRGTTATATARFSRS